MAITRRRFVGSALASGAAVAVTRLPNAQAQIRQAPHSAPTATPPLTVIAFNHMGYGPRPGDLDAFASLGPTPEAQLTAYIEQQLTRASIDDSACEQIIANTMLRIAYKASDNPMNLYPEVNEARPLTLLGAPLSQLWALARGDLPYPERRRLGANKSYGTDHGHGGVMLLLGGNVNGDKIYGKWPGLQQLDQNEDLMIETDFRTVLSEAVVRRLGNPQLGTVFPGITPEIYSANTALGIFRGTDLELDYSSAPPGGAATVYLPLTQR